MTQLVHLSRIKPFHRAFSASSVNMMPRVIRTNLVRTSDVEPSGLDKLEGGGEVSKWNGVHEQEKKSGSIDLRVEASFGNIR